MKGKKLAVLAAVVTISISIFYLSFTRLKPAHADNGLLLSLIMGGIHEVHYALQSVDDAFSEKIFSEYLSRVDYNKKIFTQKDIDILNGYKLGADDYITKPFDSEVLLHKIKADHLGSRVCIVTGCCAGPPGAGRVLLP